MVKHGIFIKELLYLMEKEKLINLKSLLQKKEAQDAEREFLNTVDRHEYNPTDMTWKQLYKEFYEYKKDKVKLTTMRTYRQRDKYFKMLNNIKLSELNVTHYQKWRSYIQKQDLAIKAKNGFHKLFKEILNYAMRWHNCNFNSMYLKMEKFSDPNALPKEMEFYTWKEFQQFINVEDEIKYIALFETLYFCGLRRGELRGLTWENIDLEEKVLSVRKNVVNEDGDSDYLHLTTPKTRTSVRDIPMPDRLVEHLKEHKENEKKKYGFNKNWFVFGDVNPIHPDILRKRKVKNAQESGVKEIRIHDFRHSCASLLINNGATIMIVAKYLGHAKIDETLNTYAHLFKNKLDEVVIKLNELD